MKVKIKLLFVFIFFIASIFISLISGSSGISVKEIINAFKSGGIDRIILFDLRLPRLVLGFFVGGALSVCGVILQALFKNPLTEPYTLGISGGAALGVVFGILMGLSTFLPLMGFLGALLVIFFVYGFSIKSGKINLNNMLLIGVMISFISSSLVLFIIALSDVNRLHNIIFWMMGSLQWASSTSVYLIVSVSLLTLIVSFIFSLNLNAISIGEEDAISLGVDTELTKKIIFGISSLAVGSMVAFTGIIGFVGLVVPHFFRIVFSKDHRILIPLSFIGGGSFLILCDAIGRTIAAPIELPVGVITGIIGGIVFIWVLLNNKTGSFR